MPLNADAWTLAKASPRFFAVKFLGLKWLPHYSDWEKLILKSKRSLVESPRGHGKSSFFSFMLPLWDVIRGEADVLIVSYSEDQVINLIRNIKQEIESNPFLEPLRPTTKEIWGADKLGFADGSIIRGLGFGTSSRGLHPKRIIGDDVLKDMGGMSPEDQERAWFSVITGMAMPYTKIHVVGTPIDFDDLLQKLENNSVYSQWKKPAIDKDGNPLCPELFTKATLEMRRQEMGSLNFAREFLLERIDPSTQPFKRQYETLYSEAPTNFANIVTVCDPAYTENDGDYTAIVTTGITHGNHAYVLEAKRLRREDPGKVVDELFKTIVAYKPGAVGISRRKGDAIHFSFVERRTRLNLWDFKYVELKETQKKAHRIGALVPRWESRTIHIHKNMADLLREIYEYRLDDSARNDDQIDALAHCFDPEMAQPNSGKMNVPLPEALQDARVLYRVGRSAVSPVHQILGRVAA